MRLPVTKYGMPEVLIYPLAILAGMGGAYLLRGFVSPDWAYIAIEVVLAVVLLWCLSFFRDPKREVPKDEDIFVSPADGRVSDIETLKSFEGFEGPVMRIGIFLSIFNVHINRVPCGGRILKTVYKKGEFKNALSAESAKVNESNDVYIARSGPDEITVMVRQISGAIARRIVCRAKGDDVFGIGERFGMIKFGSRTELYVPASESLICCVKKGEKVKAGLTVLARYENGQ